MTPMQWLDIHDEEAMLALGADLASKLRAGDIVLLSGPLGAGKTTLIRGLMAALGHEGEVRSPTFNILQEFATDPPVLHADLYRVKDQKGVGIEEYLDSHLVLIEWPDRLADFVEPEATWRIEIEFADSGRRVWVRQPLARTY